jgi:hypothetical protein
MIPVSYQQQKEEREHHRQGKVGLARRVCIKASARRPQFLIQSSKVAVLGPKYRHLRGEVAFVTAKQITCTAAPRRNPVHTL